MKPLPIEWRQSTVKTYWKCPRAFRFEHVDHIPVDHVSSGFARPRGTACHEVAATVLRGVAKGLPSWDEDEVFLRLGEAFSIAVSEAAEKGEHANPEKVDEALEELRVKWAPIMHRFAELRALRSIRWHIVEDPFRLPWSRPVKGTVDGFGEVLEEVVLDPRSRPLIPGEWVLVDWKTGEERTTGPASRAHLQSALYRAAMLHARGGRPLRVRCFVGKLGDLATPRLPAKEIEVLNPAFAQALGLEGEAAEKSRKRPKDEDGNPIPKRIKQPNPAHAEALASTKGTFWHEVEPDQALALELLRGAIRGAEAGVFPATGPLTGACRWCPYYRHCQEAPA